MKEGWQIKILDELCEIFGRIGYRGYTKNDLVSTPEEGAITLSPTNIIDGELHYDKCSYITWEKYEESPEIMVFEGDIVLVKTASIGKCALVRKLPHKATLNPQFVVLKKIKANNQYLTYFLQSPIAQKKFQEYAIGTAIPTFSQKKLGTLEVPIPPLSEQQRIVSLLDAEFAKIDTLKANAERNLQNAKDLFQAALKKELEPKEGWKLMEFELCLEKTKASTKLQSSQYGGKGLFPIVSQEKDLISGYWDDENDVFRHKTPIVVFGDHTKVVKYIDFDFVIGADGVKILYPKPFLYPKYFYFWMLSIEIPSHGYARHYRYLKEHQIPVPSLQDQQSIVARLDALNEKCKTLQANYEKTIALCDDLKQALLRKAFNGEI